ncbi:substrate-binding domain-containing protein, partial [Candidatus Aerophobetes bacterium]|nr:substrate-binding domain-containing protein [Candidatus Aerophobetes bacterium]
ALKEAGLSPLKNYVRVGYLRYDGGYDAMSSFLKETHPPTAVFCANDMMALGAINACLDKGVRIPQDIAVVGFDDMWVASLENIQLTTIRQPRYEMGAGAVELMIERIEGKRNKVKRIILPAKLVVRKTCGKFLKGD